MNEDTRAFITTALDEIFIGYSSLTTTMECLQDSRSVEDGDFSVAVDVLGTLTTVMNIYTDKLQTLMAYVDHVAVKAS